MWRHPVDEAIAPVARIVAEVSLAVAIASQVRAHPMNLAVEIGPMGHSVERRLLRRWQPAVDVPRRERDRKLRPPIAPIRYTSLAQERSRPGAPRTEAEVRAFGFVNQLHLMAAELEAVSGLRRLQRLVRIVQLDGVWLSVRADQCEPARVVLERRRVEDSSCKEEAAEEEVILQRVVEGLTDRRGEWLLRSARHRLRSPLSHIFRRCLISRAATTQPQP